MLQIENEYETPIDSIFCQNNASISNLEKTPKIKSKQIKLQKSLKIVQV